MQSVTWQSPEFRKSHHGPTWYWSSVVVALIIIGLSIWQKDWFFSALILLAEIALITWGHRNPRQFDIILDNRGLVIGNEAPRPIVDIDSVSYPATPPGDLAEMVVHFRSRFRMSLMIFVPEEMVNRTKDYWNRNSIPEVDHERTILELLARLI